MTIVKILSRGIRGQKKFVPMNKQNGDLHPISIGWMWWSS